MYKIWNSFVFMGLFSLVTSCSYSRPYTLEDTTPSNTILNNEPDYASRMPSHRQPGEKVIVINPNVHAWAAYGADGRLIRAGLATAGNRWCPDIHRACKTKPGTFRVQTLGNAYCRSTIYPLPRGGAPMPYCMFFDKNQGMHGSPASKVVEGNISHGCVRMHISDAEWLRYNFVTIGTKVIVLPY